MAQKKKKADKKGKFQNERLARERKKFIRRSAVILILIAAVLYVTSNLNNNEPTNNSKNGNNVQGYTAFEFVKHGELTFNSADGEVISKIDIEIADSQDERTTGLMYRDKLEVHQGMFFIFDIERPQSFWMRNTVLSLDILFVNKKGEIVRIHKNTEPFSEQSYPSVKPAIYVVEVNAGYTDQYNIKEGDKIIWRRI